MAAADGVGFIVAFLGRFAMELDDDRRRRLCVGELLIRAVGMKTYVEILFKAVASSKATTDRGWVNAAYCKQWGGRRTSADYKAWKEEQLEFKGVDEDDPLVSFEYSASLPRIRPGIYDSEAEKRRVRYRGKDGHAADLEGEEDA